MFIRIEFSIDFLAQMIYNIHKLCTIVQWVMTTNNQYLNLILCLNLICTKRCDAEFFQEREIYLKKKENQTNGIFCNKKML